MADAETKALTDHVVSAIEAAEASTEPFYHLIIDGVFPDDVYTQLLDLMPTAKDYRALPGRHNDNIRGDGSSTRVKIDLFPEYLRHLPPRHRELWSRIGDALRSEAVRQAFVKRLAPALKRRFGDGYESVGMYPVPMLTRDTIRLPHPAAHRHALEGHHGPALPAA